MRYTLAALLTTIILYGCDTTGVKKVEDDIVVDDIQNGGDDTLPEQISELELSHDVVDHKELSSGIKIQWFEHGEGESINYGDMLDLDFKVMLEDSTEIQNSDNIPAQKFHHFMVGFGLQFEAWDLTLEELKVGDFVEVFMPSSLLYKDKKVGDIPPNSNFITRIKVKSKVKPDWETDGNKVWVFARDYDEKSSFSEDNSITYNAIGYTQSKKIYLNTFASRKPFTMKLEDQGVIPGLKKALINAKKDDRLFIFVPSSEAYKNKGYLDLVKSYEDLFFNITVVDIQ